MEYIEKTLEMRTIKRDELINYFVNLEGKDTGNGRITGPYWVVEVSQEKLVALGSFLIPSVTVMLRCKKEMFDQMYSEFNLKFFRAGG